MKTVDKLKLLRGLYALSQEDIAKLAGTTRVFYAALERGRNNPPLAFAEALARNLFIDRDWLLQDDCLSPFEKVPFLYFAYPPNRLWASSKNAAKRRLTESCVAIMSLMPELLRENGFCYSYFAKVDDSHMLALFIVNGGQGLLMQVFGEERMTHLLEEIGWQQNIGPVKTVEIDRALFDGVGHGGLDAIGQLFEIFGIESAMQDRILSALGNVASAQYDLWWKLTENKRSEIISRIGREIVDNEVRILDLIKYLVEKECYDLFEHDSGELVYIIKEPLNYRKWKLENRT